MRIGNDRSQDEPHIDLVPLIDVILVLIIFFVVTTTFDARSTLQVQLPTASQQQTNEPPRSLSVLINAEGRYFINDQEVLRSDVESVKQTIAAVAGSDRSSPCCCAPTRALPTRPW
jgi:biopolymer transport protein ExbD